MNVRMSSESYIASLERKLAAVKLKNATASPLSIDGQPQPGEKFDSAVEGDDEDKVEDASESECEEDETLLMTEEEIEKLPLLHDVNDGENDDENNILEHSVNDSVIKHDDLKVINPSSSLSASAPNEAPENDSASNESGVLVDTGSR